MILSVVSTIDFNQFVGKTDCKRFNNLAESTHKSTATEISNAHRGFEQLNRKGKGVHISLRSVTSESQQDFHRNLKGKKNSPERESISGIGIMRTSMVSLGKIAH